MVRPRNYRGSGKRVQKITRNEGRLKLRGQRTGNAVRGKGMRRHTCREMGGKFTH